MNAEFENKLNALKEAFIEPASLLFATQIMHGKNIEVLTKERYLLLIDAHMLITGVLASAVLRVNAQVFENSPAIAERNALYASFIIGIDICETTLERGAYLQAASLIRQELETVAQIKLVRQGKRQGKTAPNISNLEKSIRSLYGALSEATHVATHGIVRQMTEDEQTLDLNAPGPVNVTRFFPAFDEDTARRLFTLHLMLMIQVVEELSLDHAELEGFEFTEKDQEAITMATQLMSMEGMVILDEV